MLVKPSWDIFRSKFNNDPEYHFEWFSYLLFCREFNLEKGWYGFQNQSAIEKSPITVGNKIIGFQSKFYQSRLNDKKKEIIDTLKKVHRDYPHLTDLIFYTNQSWTQNHDKNSDKMVNTKAYDEVYDLASEYKIALDWRDTGFFESEFVALKNNDLSRYFFDDKDHKGWKRFEDWSSKKADLQAEYYVDENVKIVSPNHDNSKALNVIDGLNEIRSILAQPKTSIRLVGVSGVGKTRFAQALFDSRIGENALNIKHVWYCDSGEGPQPIPQHFVEEIGREDKMAIVIVDNCGQELHASLTSLIQSSHKISLLTIEYDVEADFPKETSVYKIQPTTTKLISKVIERYYPELQTINIDKIAEFSGGNYRLALAISSNINNLENLSVLTDNELFKRIFYQKGELNEKFERVGQIFSLAFSFNVEDTEEVESEINILSELAEITPREAYRIIGKLYSKDVVQKRGDFRAILPHALANNLARQAISSLTNLEINKLLIGSPIRFRTSFLKRISYLHNDEKVIEIVTSWLTPQGYFRGKILNEELVDIDFKNIYLFTSICPEMLINILKIKYESDSSFLSKSNPNYYRIASLLRRLAYFDRNFEKAFLLLLEIIKTDDDPKDSSLKDLITSLFNYHSLQTEATLATRTKVIERLSENSAHDSYLLDIIDSSLGSNKRTVFLYDNDNGLVQNYNYKIKIGEIWDWFDFLLSQLSFLDIKYPERCRKIFTDNLKKIIWISGRTNEATKYLKIFHEREEFILALLEVKKIIEYNTKQLENAPNILRDLQKIEAYMEPKNTDIHLLMKTYILPKNNLLIRSLLRKKSDSEISLSGFSNYKQLVSFIGSNLSRKIIKDNLQELLASNNSTVRVIGSYSANIYCDIDQFISDLESIRNTDHLGYNHFFISGLSKSLIETDWISYKRIVNFMLSTTEFAAIVTKAISEVSTKKEHFELIFDKITQYPDINFSCLGWDLGFKREHQHTSNEVFEFVLDRLIILKSDSAVVEALLYENIKNSTVSNKYLAKILEYLPDLIENRNFYDYNYILSFLVNYSDSVRKEVFSIVSKRISNQNYIPTLESHSLGEILETLADSNTEDFLDLIYNHNQFRYIFVEREFESILVRVNETEALDWISNDKEKLEFWFANSNFYKHMGEDNYEWSSILSKLLVKSSKPEANLVKIIDNKICEVTTYTGSYSGALTERIPVLESLKQYLQENSLSNLTSVVEQKLQTFRSTIDERLGKEEQQAKERQRFEW